jgi:hypothetical protein
MTHRHRDDTSPKVFPNDPLGVHFNAHFNKKEMDRKLHERGLENKTRWGMGERNALRAPKPKHPDDEGAPPTPRKTTVTLATVKWMGP